MLSITVDNYVCDRVYNKGQEFCLFFLKSPELGFKICDLMFRCGDWV